MYRNKKKREIGEIIKDYMKYAVKNKIYLNEDNLNECNGWYTNEKRCGCGVKWCWDDWCIDYFDLNVINIFDKTPTGNFNKL